MELRDCLRSEFVDVDFKGKTKQDVLKRISELAKESDYLDSVNIEMIFDSLRKREEISSTGFGNEIAIPHARLQGIKGFVVGIIHSKKGIPFDAMDGKKVKLVVFIIGPKEMRTEHIYILSSISRILNSDDSRQAIISSNNSEELVKRFLSYSKPQLTKYLQSKPRCVFTVIVQREEEFSDILGLFSAEVPGEITVIEGSNAGRYLHSMPLFAGYWNEKPSKFNRIILAILDKEIMNDLIRRIQTILDGDMQGIHISVQDMIYSWGKLDF